MRRQALSEIGVHEEQIRCQLLRGEGGSVRGRDGSSSMKWKYERKALRVPGDVVIETDR